MLTEWCVLQDWFAEFRTMLVVNFPTLARSSLPMRLSDIGAHSRVQGKVV